MAIKHSSTADGTFSATGTTNWNADHTIDDNTLVAAKLSATTNNVLFGRTTAGAGGGEQVGIGTGVATALGVNVGSAGAFVTFNGALGTPSSGVATNLTGTAAGLTAGTVITNANLTGPITSVGNATSVASQTGTGSTFVMNTSPVLVTPNLGTPSAGVLTNATGLPVSTGISGLGTGIATALAVNVGTAGAPVVNGGVLGTPSSGTLTNATGLPIGGISATGTPGATTYLRGDGTWTTPAGAGDVIGDDTATTIQNIVAYSTTGGKNITELTGTQGDVLYHNGTNWAKLGAGTSGHFLKTNGAAANPAWAAAGGGASPTAFGGTPLANALFPAAYNMALPTGDVDLYTVPTGKRVYFMGYALRNDTGGSITHYATVKIAGTYYRLTSSATTTTAGNGAANVGYVAEAGETIAINAATTANGILSVYAIEFDDTSGLKSPKLTSVTTGDNTLYTVGSGKTAFLQNPGSPSAFVTVLSVAVGIINSSGASRDYAIKFTPSGGSTYTVSSTLFSVSNNARSNFSFAGVATMAAGDALKINTSDGTATQFIFATVLETG